MNGAQQQSQPDGDLSGTSVFLAETARNIDDLYRAAAEPGKDPPRMDLLSRIGKSTHMAPFNLMLADVQRPGARYVALREAWRGLGREVRLGAIPIIVLWPFCPVRCAYDLSDTTGTEADDSLLDRVFGEPLKVWTPAAR